MLTADFVAGCIEKVERRLHWILDEINRQSGHVTDAETRTELHELLSIRERLTNIVNDEMIGKPHA